MLPSLDVVVPARNAEATLARCLGSLFRSAYPGRLSVVVVDDGSTDGTAAVVTDLMSEEPRLRLVRQPPGGVNVARNTGVASTAAEIVGFVDSDEWVRADHLARAVSILVENPGAAGVGGPYVEVGVDRLHRCAGCRTGRVRLHQDHVGPAVELFGGNMFLRRAVLEEQGPFDANLSGLGDETAWFRRAERRHVFIYDPGLGIEHEYDQASLASVLRKRFRQGRTLPAARLASGDPPPRLLKEVPFHLKHVVQHRCTAPLERLAALAGDVTQRLTDRRRPAG